MEENKNASTEEGLSRELRERIKRGLEGKVSEKTAQEILEDELRGSPYEKPI